MGEMGKNRIFGLCKMWVRKLIECFIKMGGTVDSLVFDYRIVLKSRDFISLQYKEISLNALEHP